MHTTSTAHNFNKKNDFIFIWHQHTISARQIHWDRSDVWTGDVGQVMQGRMTACAQISFTPSQHVKFKTD